MIAVITEKPSVSAEFAKAVGAVKKSGYYEGNGYIIANAFGHLLKLIDAEDYHPDLKEWKKSSLPIIPDTFIYKDIDSGTKKQLSLIKRLFTRDDVQEVIVAGDAGREGELIARLIINRIGLRPDVKLSRFWSSAALTPDVVNAGISDRKPLEDYDNLYYQGLYRQHSDWILGINFSRLFTVMMNSLFVVGRVQTPILNILCQLEEKIEKFKPSEYFVAIGHFKAAGAEFEAAYILDEETKFTDKALLKLVQNLSGKGSVQEISIELKKELPPQLYDLTSLQADANRAYGFSASKTLSLCQRLYETHKCLSYPRTPSRVMADSDVDLFRSKFDLFKPLFPAFSLHSEESNITLTYKRIFDSSKLEDHHALIPLAPLPDAATAEEKHIFMLVISRFFASIASPCTFKTVKMALNVQGSVFQASGRVYVDKGWKNAVTASQRADIEEEPPSLPELAEGSEVYLSGVAVATKHTQPPKRLTEAAILKLMSNPKKYIVGDFSNTSVGLGTPATRSDIIESLVRRQYLTRSNKSLIPTSKGRFLISALSGFPSVQSLLLVDETVRWEEMLTRDPSLFYSRLAEFVRTSVAELKASTSPTYVRESLGACPLCGSPVYVGNKTYFCKNSTGETPDCSFRIYKEISGTAVSIKEAQTLLSGKKTRLKTFTSKKGNPFKANLVIDKSLKKIEVTFVFQD